MTAQCSSGDGWIIATCHLPILTPEASITCRMHEMFNVSVWVCVQVECIHIDIAPTHVRSSGNSDMCNRTLITSRLIGYETKSKVRRQRLNLHSETLFWSLWSGGMDSKVPFREVWSHFELMKVRIHKTSPWKFWGNLKIIYFSSPVHRAFVDRQNSGGVMVSWVGLIWLYLSWS